MKRSTRNLSLLLIITAAAAWFYQDTLVGFWHQTTGTSAAQAPTDGAVNKGGDARKGGKGGKGDKAEKGGRPGGGFGGPTAVGVVTVALADLPTTLEATGSIIALQSVPLRAQVNALIKSVAVKEGQSVRAGTLLFVLDDRSVEADLSKAQAQAARSKASLADLQRQLTRAQDLLKKNFVASSAVDTAASQVEAQKGQVTADEAAVKAQQIQRSLYQIRAPFSGRIGAIDVSAGALVASGANATPLTTLTQFNPIGVRFSLPESAISQVASAGINRPVTVTLGSNALGTDTKPHQGKLTLIDNAINPNTGMLTLKATLPNKDNALWPGQFVDVSLDIGTLAQVAVIPQAAVVIGEQGTSVFVVGAENKARVKRIQVRQALGERVAVSGLADGDQVVVDGRANVKPGGVLRVAGARSKE